MFSILYQIQQDNDAAFQQASEETGKWIVILSMIGFSALGVTLFSRWLRNSFMAPYIGRAVTQLKDLLPDGVTLPWTRRVTRNTQDVTVTTTVTDGMDNGLEGFEADQDYRVTVESVTPEVVTVTPVSKVDQYGYAKACYWIPWLLGSKDFFHLLLVASTGSGKTTIIRAMYETMGQLGKVVMLSPKIQYDIDVLGAGYGFNPEQIEWAMRELTELLKERGLQFAHGKSDFEPIYIIVDDWTWIKENAKDVASAFMREISNMGREVRMHLITSNQSGLVEDLGISSAIRENFSRVYLSEKAIAAAERNKLNFGLMPTPRPAWLEHKQVVGPVSVIDCPDMIKAPAANISYHLTSMEKFEQAKARLESAEQVKRQEPLRLRSLMPPETPEVLELPTPIGNLEEYTRGVLLVAEHENDQNFSIRDFARQMGYGDGGGNHSNKAKRLLAQIYENSGKTIPAYRTLVATRETADA